VSADLEGPGAKAMLLIRNGGFEGMSYEITAEETLIGRNPTTDITPRMKAPTPSKTCSRQMVPR
jgi:hypothetical protein